MVKKYALEPAVFFIGVGDRFDDDRRLVAVVQDRPVDETRVGVAGVSPVGDLSLQTEAQAIRGYPLENTVAAGPLRWDLAADG